MLHADCDDGIALVPLKENRCPGEQMAHRPESASGVSRCARQQDQHALGECACNRPAGRKFVDSKEWQWTQEVCNGLFRAFGKYYDEKWFPTIIREWSLLYYQCTHQDDYWERRDEWLAGDEEIRNTMWSAILFERTKEGERIDELKKRIRDRGGDTENCTIDEEEAQKVRKADTITRCQADFFSFPFSPWRREEFFTHPTPCYFNIISCLG